MTSLPLPGYQVAVDSDGTSDVRFIVKHGGSRISYCFDADTQTTRDRLLMLLLYCNLIITLILGANRNERYDETSVIMKCTF